MTNNLSIGKDVTVILLADLLYGVKDYKIEQITNIDIKNDTKLHHEETLNITIPENTMINMRAYRTLIAYNSKFYSIKNYSMVPVVEMPMYILSVDSMPEYRSIDYNIYIELEFYMKREMCDFCKRFITQHHYYDINLQKVENRIKKTIDGIEYPLFL